MNFRKIIKMLSVLTLAMAIFLCGCSGEGESSLESDTSSMIEEPQNSAKVGYIYNEKVSRDNNTLMFEKTRYDMQMALDIETCYLDDVPVSKFSDAVTVLKNEGCNIIVSTAKAFASSAYSVAKSDKDIYMLSYGGDASLSNLICFQTKLYQPAFVCGAVAAYNSNAHTIGVICDDMMYCANAVIDAFVLGVEEIYKTSETDVKVCYANTEKESKQAIDELNRLGCDVIFAYQSDNYSLAYADTLGIKTIGYVNDILYAAPKHGLMGYYDNFATAFTDAVSNCINKNFAPGVIAGGISEAFVRITSYTDSCKKKTDSIADSLYDYVKKGNAKIFVGELRDHLGNGRVSNGMVLKHEQIIFIDYLVYGVSYIKNFIEPVETVDEPDFIVKTDFIR